MPRRKKQSGGFAFLPAAAAAYAALNKIKPFSKAKDFLNSSTFDGKRGNIGYKIVDGVANVGKSIGFGYPTGYPSSTGIGTIYRTPAKTNPMNMHAATPKSKSKKKR